MHACWKDGPSILRPPTWAWASTQQAPTLHGPWMAPRRVRVGAWRSRTALAHRLLAPLDLWSPCTSLLTLDCTVHGLVLYHMALSCARLVLFQKPNPKELDIFTTQFLSTAHSICDVWCRISRVYRISSQRSTRCRSTSLRYYTFNSLQVTQLYYPFYPARDREPGPLYGDMRSCGTWHGDRGTRAYGLTCDPVRRTAAPQPHLWHAALPRRATGRLI